MLRIKCVIIYKRLNAFEDLLDNFFDIIIVNFGQ